ncbi:MAG: FkbM family methyltransferase [Pseudomonadota bacterium]
MREWIKRAGLALGVDVRSARHQFAQRLVGHFNRVEQLTLLDVGANVGQFGLSMFSADFNGRLVSFEPLPGARAELQNKAARYPGRWEVSDAFALSDRSGEARFNVAANLASSSFLNQSNDMRAVAPFAAKTHEIVVRTARLDDVLYGYVRPGASIALKIDVQGAEGAVLAGARESLGRMRYVMLEQSIAGLYDGQPRYFELDETLRLAGFKLLDLEPGFRDPATGELLEFDALYGKEFPA